MAMTPTSSRAARDFFNSLLIRTPDMAVAIFIGVSIALIGLLYLSWRANSRYRHGSPATAGKSDTRHRRVNRRSEVVEAAIITSLVSYVFVVPLTVAISFYMSEFLTGPRLSIEYVNYLTVPETVTVPVTEFSDLAKRFLVPKFGVSFGDLAACRIHVFGQCVDIG
jgi:hypothetical protein